MSRQIEMKFSYGEQVDTPRRALPRDLLLEVIKSRLDYTANLPNSSDLFPQSSDSAAFDSFETNTK